MTVANLSRRDGTRHTLCVGDFGKMGQHAVRDVWYGDVRPCVESRPHMAAAAERYQCFGYAQVTGSATRRRPLEPPANEHSRQVNASPPAESEETLRDKMYRQDVKEEKDPVPCHGRHGIDAAGAKDGTGRKGQGSE